MNNSSKTITSRKFAKVFFNLSLIGLAVGCSSIPRDVPNTITLNRAVQGAPTTQSQSVKLNQKATQYADLQARLNKLNASGAMQVTDAGASKQADDPIALTSQKYQWAKAQCWVRNAYSERHENDASGFPVAALAEASRIIDGLEKRGLETQKLDQSPTALINHSKPLRADLWERLQAVKSKSGFACSVQTVACSEVQLSRAGHENSEGGWRNANPYIAIAEDMADKAEQQAAVCQASPKPVVAPPPAVAPVVAKAEILKVEPTKAPVVEKINLNASALFKFDRRQQSDMLLEGKQQLDALAQRIQGVYASVESIDLTGFTDRLGSDAYNLKLSTDRANTVKSYLASKGLVADMKANGKGKLNPVVQCKVEKLEARMPSKQLTDCLQPNRRVEIVITGVKK
jgi:OmpA-OmpF porin, OOP family